MTNGSIDIDDTQGDVSGVIKDSVGSIGAKIIKVRGDLIINNPTKNEEATLRKIQHLSTETGAVGGGNITREELKALQQGINRLLNLLETNHAQTITAGDVELSLKEILLKGDEYFKKGECFGKGNFITAIEYYDQAIRRNRNSWYAWV